MCSVHTLWMLQVVGPSIPTWWDEWLSLFVTTVLTGYSDPLECSVGLELPHLGLTRAGVTPFIQVYDSSDGSGTPQRATALTGVSAPYEVIKSVYTLLGFIYIYNRISRPDQTSFRTCVLSAMSEVKIICLW